MKSFLKILTLIACINTFAMEPETDLTNPKYSELEILDHVLNPSSNLITINSQAETLVLIKLIRENGTIEILENLDLETNCAEGIATSRLDNRYFKIKNIQTYEIHGEVECGKTNYWIFNASEPTGQVIAIYDIAMKAVNKMSRAGIINSWTSKVNFRFPADGDYYNWNTVNVSRGDHWDVVGHELGHAIYDQGNIGAFGGGSHKIDQCYSGALALSEGWASFFSAWLSIDITDINAKFEYLVPRRAPITIEYIPADVCAGPRNEWRVTGFLWDLIDLAYDNESAETAFETLWNINKNKDYGDVKELARDLIRNGFDPILINVIYKQNFLEEL
ncbi:hypothetical protein [Bacteriovorax sp. Seq25_V]|uniref:hypothetical protein n=1 Tax=Bacteriovorax sp. Seq25_V TaxID=1201288 RepID=UPI00038A42C8|nr:hypothetical protein [Bacteriovorax sp. Seq25_V]EQC45248.1 hypothetical protein M900_2035 [Bacteriovorax sp. Seq25_V]